MDRLPGEHDVRVKVCCITSKEEASAAVSLGADRIGLIASHPGVETGLSDRVLAETGSWVPDTTDRVLLTPYLDAPSIVAHVERVGVGVVQICDHVGPEVHRAIRAACPLLEIVQVVHVEGASSIALARMMAGSVDALLLDSGVSGADFSVLGGTGRTHDWAISRAIVDAVSLPVWLAGGLNPENVGRGIETVRPYGVDLCSGVRVDGALDLAKLRRFMAAVRSG